MEQFKPKYLNLLTDYGFKRIFGSESCKDLLIDFLNELIEDQGRIVDLKYLPTEQLGTKQEDRKAVFDLYCKSDCNKFFIVELQRVRQTYFKERSIYYSTFPLQKQALKGIWNFQLNPVYTIAILDFILFESSEEKDIYYHTVKLMNETSHEVFYEKLVYKYLELPKFREKEEKLNSNFERWIYLLKNLPTLENRPLRLQGKIFDKLFKYAEIEQLTTEEMKEYKKSILEYDDIQDALGYAKKIAAEEGWQEGRKEGLEKSRTEIAMKCLKKGMAVEDIIELTGLTLEQITNLQQSE